MTQAGARRADISPAGAGLSRAALAAAAAIALLTAMAWIVLVAEALRRGGGADAFLDVLCRPVGLAEGTSLADALAGAGPTLALWAAMAVAMMLPTAVPMAMAAAERMEDAGAGRRAGPVLALLSGYLAVWLAAALAAGLVQVAGSVLLARAGLPPKAAPLLAGILVGAAGLYQFSSWKLRSLAFCRHPLSRLVPGRSIGAGLALREGLDQGLACLGCCAAMMAAMAVAGLMNIFWMAALSAVMTAEKFVAKPWAARLVGAALLLAGVAMSVSAVGPGNVLRFLAA